MQYLRLKKPYAPAQYPQLLSQTFGRGAAAVATRYPLTRYDGSVALAYSAAVTDGVFACVADRMAAGLAKEDSVYAYEFNDRGAPAPEALRTLPFPVGASHSLELRYLFDIGGAPALTPDQQKLSDEMIDAWSQFVRDGHPGDDWPAFDGEEERLSLRPGGSRRGDRLRPAASVPVLGRPEGMSSRGDGLGSEATFETVRCRSLFARGKASASYDHHRPRGRSHGGRVTVHRRNRLGGATELRQRPILGSDHQHVSDAASGGRLRTW